MIFFQILKKNLEELPSTNNWAGSGGIPGWVTVCNLQTQYRVTLVVVDLGWVDFDSDVPSSCPAAQPVLPNPHWPKQNQADIGTSKYKSTKTWSTTTSVTLYNNVLTLLTSCRQHHVRFINLPLPTWQMLLLQWHTLAAHAPAVGLLESKNVLFCENVSPHPAVTATEKAKHWPNICWKYGNCASLSLNKTDSSNSL